MISFQSELNLTLYSEVTPEGRKALAEIKRVTEAVWQDVPSLGFEHI